MLFIITITSIFSFASSINGFYLSDDINLENIDQKPAEKVIIVLHENGGIYGLKNTKLFHLAIQPLNNNINSTDLNSNENIIEPHSMEAVQTFEYEKINERNDITHVANGGKYTVYAMVEKDKQYLQNVSDKFFEVARKSNWQMPEIPFSFPFTQIRPRTFEAFNPRAAPNQNVYITVFSHDITNGKIERIANAYEIKSGSGVVIGSDNKIHDVVDGKIWVDSTGKSHSRRPQNV